MAAKKSKSKKSSFSKAFTPEQRKYIERYISHVAGLMELGSWTIEVDWATESPADALAANSSYGDSTHCVVTFNRAWVDMPSDMQRQVLVHELCHCYLFAIDESANDAVEVLGTKREAALFQAQFNNHIEMVTDRLADTISKFLPEFRMPAADSGRSLAAV